MKKITSFFKAMAVACLFLSAGNFYGQICNANFSYTIGSNGSVVFSNLSSPAAQSTYTWDYGDASPVTIASQTTSITHTYPNGTWYVLLSQHNFSAACNDTMMAPITITNSACNVNLIPNYTFTNTSNGSYNFASTSVNTSSTTSYTWYFGDATTGTGSSVSHTYAATGNYNLKLVLQDGACSDSIMTVFNVVANPCTVTPSFTYSYNIPGQQYVFTSTSTGTIAASSYTYDFGDGNFGYNKVSTHAYAASGNYTVVLAVTNSTASPCVMYAMQTVSAVASPTVPCNLVAGYTHTVGSGGNVNFNNTSTGTNTNTIYFWNFGDGYTGTGPNPVHTYTNAGAYNVTLMVDNQTSPVCMDTIIQTINVTGIACVANSSFSMASASSTTQVWNAMPASPWNIVAATWNWGDNTSSNVLYTSHTYSAAGVYSICLSVTVSCGATSTTCDTNYIYRSTQSAQMIQVNVIAPPAIVAGLANQSNESVDWSVYPNPNNGQFEIKMDGKTNAKIKVYSLIGQMVYETEITNDNVSKKINLDGVSNGVYFIKLNSNNKEYTKKIIVNN